MKYSTIFLMVLSMLVYGCGDSAENSPADSTRAQEGTTPVQELTNSVQEKAPGVVYQDEIYENWPYN